MKHRLDKALVEKGLVRSRNLGAELIKSGSVIVNGQIITKTSELIDEKDQIEIKTNKVIYVGRGGEKLEGALCDFKISVKGLIILDVGSSTGGFTDCVLKNGAKKVYAIDVGTDQLSSYLRNDPRIILMEKTDIRSVTNLPDQIDLVVIDVSFISLELVLPSVINLISSGTKIISLVKPQFETDHKDKNKSGIVKSAELQENSLKKIKDFCRENKIKVLAETISPILGGSGNKEFFLLLEK